MATLNEGAVSFAAVNWSDATGFANAATLTCNKPAGVGGIQAGLDQSALTGINYLDFVGNFSGNIGGPGASLIVDFDLGGSNDENYTGASPGADVPISRVRHWAKGGDIYLSAGASDGYIFQTWGGNSFITGGDITRIHSQGSAFVRFFSAATCDASARWFLGGVGSFIDYHASDAMVTTFFYEGTHTIKRTFGTIYVMGTATVIIDTATLGGTAIHHHGGTVKILSMNTCTNYHGVLGYLDLRDLSGLATFSNSELCPGLTIYNSPYMAYGTVVPVGTGPKVQ